MNNPKSKKIRFLLTLLLILGILIIGLIGGFLYLAKDELSPRDDDLRLSRVEIPEQENAFYPLDQAIKQMYWPKEKTEIDLIKNIIKGQEWNPEFVQGLLEKNKESFSFLEKDYTLLKFQDPQLMEPEKITLDTPLTNVGGYRDIARLNLVKSLSLFKQGKEKESFDEVIKTIKLGQLVENSQGGFIHYLIGFTIKEEGLETLRVMIKDIILSPETLKDYIKELNKYKSSKEALKNVLKMEYMMSEKALPTLAAKDIVALQGLSSEEEIPLGLKIAVKFPYFYKPNKTKRIIAESYRTLIDNVDKNYGEISKIEQLTSYSLSPIKILLTENIVGKIFHDIIVIPFGANFYSRIYEEDFSVIGTQLLLAIKGYQIETGETITSLDNLVPRYFTEVPKDPFDEKQIRFSAEKKIIYSVGKDLKDSGGSEGDDLRKMPDPTFKIEF